MSDDRWLSMSLTALGVLGATELPFDAALLQVTTLATWVVEDADGAAIIWSTGDGQVAKAASHEFAGHLDQGQHESGQGPSARALAEQRVVTGQVVAERRGSHQASQRGGDMPKRAVLAAPLSVGDSRLGVLSLYSPLDQTFDDLAAAEVSLFALHAGMTLRAARSHDATKSRVVELEEALASRPVIDQAKGILMAARRCASQDALDQLWKVSQITKVSLFDLATRLVASVDGRASSADPRVRGQT